MPGIIEFPLVVQDAVAQYADLFANECQRRHFAEYLTGLMVAERKTVLGINGEFASTTDQSCRNRFLTAADWDVQVLNEQRLRELQKATIASFCKDIGTATSPKRWPSIFVEGTHMPLLANDI